MLKVKRIDGFQFVSDFTESNKNEKGNGSRGIDANVWRKIDVAKMLRYFRFYVVLSTEEKAVRNGYRMDLVSGLS